MRLLVSLIYFSVLVTFTASLYGQSGHVQSSYSGDITNAVQDQRLQDIEKRSDQTDVKLNTVTDNVVTLTNSMNRFTGIGIGMGATLTILQALQIILQVRKKPAS
jgi:hypothetical protein